MKKLKQMLSRASHSNLNVVNERNIAYVAESTAFNFFIVIIFIILLFNIPSNPKDIKYVQIAGQNIKVSLALTPAEQEQGLSARQDLAESQGMLFVFTNLGKYPFWMKDMNFPIDIIWLSEDLKVVYIKKDARPESYPETYGPENVPTPKGVGIPTVNVGTKYVLEVMSGFSDKNNLKVGDGVEFTRTLN